jgi:hypothetical protein
MRGCVARLWPAAANLTKKERHDPSRTLPRSPRAALRRGGGGLGLRRRRVGLAAGAGRPAGCRARAGAGVRHRRVPDPFPRPARPDADLRQALPARTGDRPLRRTFRGRHARADRLWARRRIAHQCRRGPAPRSARVHRSGVARGDPRRRPAERGLRAGGGVGAAGARCGGGEPHQVQGAARGGHRTRQGAGRGTRRRRLRALPQPGRRRATRLHALRRLLRGMQRRRQEHGGAHLPARRGAPRRPHLYPRQGGSRRQGTAGRLAGLLRAPG